MSLANELEFTKLEALGNDFVLIDGRTNGFEPQPDAIIRLGDRRRGIGFDQLLVLQPGRQAGSHCEVVVFNNDGSSAEQCGNGMRAVALWLSLRSEIGRHARLDTAGGAVDVVVDSPGHITATLAIPDFSPLACGLSGQADFPRELALGERTINVFGASLGNPHLVLICPEPATPEALQRLGPPLSIHPELADGANIGLACIENPHRINLRVFERGAGATAACGSGACAAAAVLIHAGKLRSPVEVVQPGGVLVIDWNTEGEPVSMTGPAHQVFRGSIPWPKLAN